MGHIARKFKNVAMQQKESGEPVVGDQSKFLVKARTRNRPARGIWIVGTELMDAESRQRILC
jgi:hypothetical protein